jgi:uncharacterized protein
VRADPARHPTRFQEEAVMQIRAELLAMLRCPVTTSSLVQEGDQLVSSAPGPEGTVLRYAIEDDIVLLLRPEQLADAPGAS